MNSLADSTPQKTPVLSIVTPAFREALNLPLLHGRMISALSSMPLEWEWIIVDDHSPDHTFEVASQIAKADPRVRVIRFSRNAGSHAAIRCGMDRARGRCAVAIASDLQDDPALIPELVAKWKEGAKIVWAARSLGSGAAHRPGVFSRFYWWLLKRLAGLHSLPPGGADAFLVDASVIRELRRFKESNASLFLLLSWVGFRQETIVVGKGKRAYGSSGWTLSKKWKLFMDSITAFSSLPIRLIGALGLATAFLGFLYAGFIVLTAWTTGERPAGWSSLMVAVLVIGGTQMLFLSLLGEYLWRALDEARGRPLYLVEEEFPG